MKPTDLWYSSQLFFPHSCLNVLVILFRNIINAVVRHMFLILQYQGVMWLTHTDINYYFWNSPQQSKVILNFTKTANLSFQKSRGSYLNNQDAYILYISIKTTKADYWNGPLKKLPTKIKGRNMEYSTWYKTGQSVLK